MRILLFVCEIKLCAQDYTTLHNQPFTQYYTCVCHHLVSPKSCAPVAPPTAFCAKVTVLYTNRK